MPEVNVGGWRLVDRLRNTMSLTRGTNGADEGSEVRDAIDRLDENLAEIVKLVHWDGFRFAGSGRHPGYPPHHRAQQVSTRTRHAPQTHSASTQTINLSEMKT